MTTYHLSIGYNACRGDKEEDFDLLLSEAERLKDDPQRLISEVASVEPQWTAEQLEPYADSEMLRNPANRWLTVKRATEVPEVGHSYLTLWASTNDGPKYAIRRAMVRLLMVAMHSEGIELCVEVA